MEAVPRELSCRPTSRSTRTTTRRSRSARARRSRSRTSSRRCARCSSWRAPSACSTSARARATRPPCSPCSPQTCVSIERLEALAVRARAALEETGHASVEVRLGDGRLGAPDRAPFDAIAVAAAHRAGAAGALRAARRWRPTRPAAWRPAGTAPRHGRADGGRPRRDGVAGLPLRSTRRRVSRTHRVGRYSRRRWTSRRRRAAPRQPVDASTPPSGGGRTGSSSSSSASWGRRATSSTSWSTPCSCAAAGFHYVPAAIGSFLVAVTNNYLWNRLWTFRRQRGDVVLQGLRFFVVSALALGANLSCSTCSSAPGSRSSSRRRSRSSSSRP